MKKEEYLGKAAVHGFATWLAMRLLDDAPLVTLHMKDGQRPVNGLATAFAFYEWSFKVTIALETFEGRDFGESEEVLDRIRNGLRASVKLRNDMEARAWCITAFQWGHVAHGNVKWANGLRGISDHLSDVSAKLRSDEDNCITTERFNSGMTKIYSLLIDDFIIYDSRVAAALAWFVQAWRADVDQPEDDPGLLAFACMRPKEGVTALRRKRRRPEAGHFPLLNGNSAKHALWNMRANWILRESLTRAQVLVTNRDRGSHLIVRHPRPLRALEAALFMWGYDLPRLPLSVRRRDVEQRSVSA